MLSLSKQDTSIMKGIAICAMLFHHLYCSIPNWISPYGGVLFGLGDLGKVCVSLFLFCSGYGLSCQFGKVVSAKGTAKFMIKRFTSFYLNYWVVFVVFVPITVIAFHRPLTVPYGENVNIWKCLVLDFFGLLGIRSYNITWWFNKLIIILWLLFPFIFWCVKKMPLLSIIGSAFIARFWMSIIGWDYYGELYLYQFSFVLGMFCKLWGAKWSGVWNGLSGKRTLFSIISVFLVAFFVYVRMKAVIPHWSGVRIDAFLSWSIALLVLSLIRYTRFLSKALSFLGMHSGNIYLIHTFFNVYWHPQWLHTSAFMRSGVNFVVLLGLCLLTSVLLEVMKERMGIYALSRRLIDRIC